MKKIKYLFHSKVVRVSKISDSIVFTACYSFVSKRNLGFLEFFSNMKAYVIVRGSVANIRNIVAMRSGQKLFAFTVANDLVRSDRLF